ncbi:23S rRNA (uracil(1939)-C(5))-methyltransferase RlmD [Candidatus Gracilibacteria bacterium]|nr:23S rRNA (uracil(1939)-C(5))-methyltransferase RlmD [Candidatus Gracilibacteria bacterium]
MKQGNILNNIYIYKIGYGGIGIGALADGKKVLVKGGALPKSTVDIKVVKKKKDFIQGHIIEIKKYDKKYTDGEVFCPHYFIPIGISEKNKLSHKIGCGGCKWQIMNYNKQLELKHEIIKDGFGKILKKIENLEIPSVIGAPIQKGYRNKIEFSFGVYISAKEGIDHRQNLGFHKQGEFSKIVDIDSCGLISSKANQIFEYIKNICFQSGLPVFDQKTHQGFFRHLVIREGFNTNQILVNLSVFENNLKNNLNKKRDDFVENIKKDNFLKEHITSFVITNNNGLADTVKSDQSETKTLRGDGFIYETLKFDEIIDKENKKIECNFRVSPFSFFQTNTLGAQNLLYEAYKMTGHIKGTILDLYCGTGTIGISFLKAARGKNLVGVEIVQEAIIDAQYNAKINGVDKDCFFLASASEKAFTDNIQLKEKIKDLELVIVDPPRDGMHKNLISFLIDLKKESDFKLLYISCNPITMARDIEILIDNGFKTKKIQAVDMFPQTHHIELISVLG